MDRQAIQETVLFFVQECGNIRSDNYDVSLFSADFGFQACDMAHVLIGIYNTYSIPMERLMKELQTYSVHEIVHCVAKAQKAGNP